MIAIKMFLIWLGHMALAMLVFGLRPDFLRYNTFMSGMLFALAMCISTVMLYLLFDILE